MTTPSTTRSGLIADRLAKAMQDAREEIGATEQQQWRLRLHRRRADDFGSALLMPAAHSSKRIATSLPRLPHRFVEQQPAGI